MSVVVWDGTTLAADRQSIIGGIRNNARKIWRLHDGSLFGICGLLTHGIELRAWIEMGSVPTDFPRSQSGKNFVSNILILPNGQSGFYEKAPVFIPNLDQFIALGSGADLAYGAHGAGADARRAVEIASAYHVECGMGVDWTRLDGTGNIE